MNKLTILCVDDESNVLKALRDRLLRYFPHCTIEIAESEAAALELIDELLEAGREVSVAIVAANVQGVKGDEFAIALHKHHPQIINIMPAEQTWSDIDLLMAVSEALRCYEQEKHLVEQRSQLQVSIGESDLFRSRRTSMGRYCRTFDRRVHG